MLAAFPWPLVDMVGVISVVVAIPVRVVLLVMIPVPVEVLVLRPPSSMGMLVV